MNENGTTNFFENGIEGGEFRMGINGSVLLDNSLVEFLPADYEIELGRSTVIVNLEEEGRHFLQVAGQSGSDDVAKVIFSNIGAEALSDVVKFSGSLFEVYFYIGDDLESSQLYLYNTVKLGLPLVGEQELSRALLEITRNHVYAEGSMLIPGLGSVELTGNFNFNGSFRLTNTLNRKVDLGVASLEMELMVVVASGGVEIVVMAAACIIDDKCIHVEVDLAVDWQNDEIRACVDLPGLGRHCGTIKV